LKLNYKKKYQNKFFLILIFLFCLSQGLGMYFYSGFDPRGSGVEAFQKRTEHSYYQLKGSVLGFYSWPGLTALDFSLTWLNVLSSTDTEAGLEGDFSWYFHKLRFLSKIIPQADTRFQSAILPFFVVIGKDAAGAQLLFNEKLARGDDVKDWRVAYWAAFHAMENLSEKKLAGELFLRASHSPGSPHYLPALGFRLIQGEDALSSGQLRSDALKKLSPELQEKLRALRPEWFK
jgi:hypothetical protein